MWVLHGPLIHLMQPFKLCWSIHHSTLGYTRAHCCSLRKGSIPAMPIHLPVQ